MIRIAGKAPAASPQQAAPPDDAQAQALMQALAGQGQDPSQGPGQDPTQDPTQGQIPLDPSKRHELEKVDPSIASYMGPEYGPFMCQNCDFFDGPKSCHMVSGNIDPSGCCNLFTPKDNQDQTEGMEPPQEEAGESPDQEAVEQPQGPPNG